MSDSLWLRGLQHTRLPCPSPTPGLCSNSCPWSRWCHPTISSSVIPVSSCLQSFPASGSFQNSQLFASSGQSIGTSASASVLPVNIQGWFSLGLSDLFSLLFLLYRHMKSTPRLNYHNQLSQLPDSHSELSWRRSIPLHPYLPFQWGCSP